MKKNIQDLKVAVVYDHLLTRFGGAEFVLETIIDSIKNVTLFTTVHDEQDGFQTTAQVITSPLQKYLPFVKKREVLDLLTPITIEQFNFSEFDIVISITSSAVKGIITTPKQLHICYLLTPTRYLYHDAEELQNSHPFFSLPLLKTVMKWVLNYLRWWDQVAAWRPDAVIAISNVVAKRCEQFYSRNVDEILYPPVRIPQKNKLKSPTISDSFVLCLSRLMPYKRLDLAIAAAQMAKKLLVLAGDGPEMLNLQKLTRDAAIVRQPEQSIASLFAAAKLQKKSVLFIGKCSKIEKEELLTSCQAVLMPGIEDFGIAAVEATAFGKPAILSDKSGAAEVLQHGVHALHVKDQTAEAYCHALQELEEKRFDSQKLLTNAARFSQEQFVRKFHNICFAISTEHSTIVS